MVKRVADFLFSNSVFLIAGTLAGLLWANLAPSGYAHLLHFEVLPASLTDALLPGGGRALDFHFLINDILMALFFALAGKEVWEAMLPGGALNNPRSAAPPLIAAVGGMAGPALLYVLGASLIGRLPEYGSGWAIPCATDIAFSYMVARLVFGAKHPAIPFLLLLAIADDALGLIILAVFYPQGEVAPAFLLLSLLAVGIGLLFRRFGLHSSWPYLLVPGTLSWAGFAAAGLHPALGLLPILPTLPHAHSNPDRFNWEKFGVKDTLNRFEHGWKKPVEIVLGLFGLLNAGVAFGAVGAPTLLVLTGLLVGKPAGIWLGGMFAGKTLRFGLPEGVTPGDLFAVGCAAGIGFTVALFVATVAFEPGTAQDAAKMGALASFSAAFLTVAAARMVGVSRRV